MAHMTRYRRIVEVRHSTNRCRHPGCAKEGDPYEFPDGTFAGCLCWRHASDHGFCPSCGHFVAGSENDMLFARRGECSECWDEHSADFADDDNEEFCNDEDTYWDRALQECGQFPGSNGACMNAGTEQCDFECPFSGDDLEDE